ncbi:hypothetical protein BC937DRAFT_88949 [Endogone sp. FLAS-F59071]|nr:hypothetical protein BC937DRAFT_88949 [Endogone sp. FLAS-F59071]|eukprot:RUS18300.1 hypothetical protein BC937DRAFT_88949 [Endogone sp. FLAS-F59071]
MLTSLPPELYLTILSYLDFEDAETLLYIIPDLRTYTLHYLHTAYPFQANIAVLLSRFEPLTPSLPPSHLETLATALLDQIRLIVEAQPKFNHRASFTEHLDILQSLILHRLLSPRRPQPPGYELRYAELCLAIREHYLHSNHLRSLHDFKYRRRSTRVPTAPFLPRFYIDQWRTNCRQAVTDLSVISYIHSVLFPVPFTPTSNSGAEISAMLARQTDRLTFARFYGRLFHVSSVYHESHLEGTMDECIREALVSGDVEALLIMYEAAGRDPDVDALCGVVRSAGEQLYEHLRSLPPAAATEAAGVQQQSGFEGDEGVYDVPEWLRPERYQINEDVVTRLRLLVWLRKRGKKWKWN